MKNNKGQALVEFIVILPIVLMLLFTIVDFSRVVSLKNDLESKTNDAVTLYEAGKSKEDIERLIDFDSDTNLTVDVLGDYTNITCKKTIKPITPGLSYIIKKVFDVEVNRVVRND